MSSAASRALLSHYVGLRKYFNDSHSSSSGHRGDDAEMSERSWVTSGTAVTERGWNLAVLNAGFTRLGIDTEISAVI